MKKGNPVWVFAIIAIFILAILNIVFSIRISETSQSLIELEDATTNTNFTKKITLQGNCPDSIGGNDQAYLRIKYFYSDFCPWCQREEPILQKIVQENGNLFYIEWFNINSCSDDVKKYKIGGVPTFIFSTSDEKKEYSHYGFIYEDDLRKLICDVTGGC